MLNIVFYLMIPFHTEVIFRGDLNYRISLFHGDTIELVEKYDYEDLLEKDQVRTHI